MNKILFILAILSIAGFALGPNANPKEFMYCFEENGIEYCSLMNYVTDITVKFLEPITCISTDTTQTGDMANIMDEGCFAELEIVEYKTVDLPFAKSYGEVVEEVTRKIDLEPGYIMTGFIDANLIPRNNCIEIERTGTTRYTCGSQNQVQAFSGALLISEEKGAIFIITDAGEEKDVSSFLIENWTYILLILIVVFLIYSIIKRKKR